MQPFLRLSLAFVLSLAGSTFFNQSSFAIELCSQLNTPTKSEDSLTISVKSLSLVERPATNVIQISYNLANTIGEKQISEGSFTLFFEDGTSSPQYGIFGLIAPQDYREKSYIWEYPKNLNLVSITYISRLSPEVPLASKLSWAVPGKGCLVSILLDKAKAEKQAAEQRIAERDALKKETAERAREALKVLVDQAATYRADLIKRINELIKRAPSERPKLNTLSLSISGFGAISETNYKDAEKLLYSISDQVDEIQYRYESSLRTITCIKGKQVKKITGVAPKCPSGYKKK